MFLSRKAEISVFVVFFVYFFCSHQPGVKLPPVHQRCHQPRAGALHLALLHRPALSAPLPGGCRLFQLLPRPLRQEDAGAAAERTGSRLQPRRKHRPAGAHIRVVHRNLQ